MRRRTVLAAVAGGVASLAGCRSTSRGSGGAGESPTDPSTPAPGPDPTPTPVPEKPGRVANHRTTAVAAISHDAVRRTSADGDGEWVVTVTLRLEPQDTDVATAYPIGVFFLFLDADGRRIHRVYEQVPANTGHTARTVRLSAAFRPSEAGADSFHAYRIDLVHG